MENKSTTDPQHQQVHNSLRIGKRLFVKCKKIPHTFTINLRLIPNKGTTIRTMFKARIPGIASRQSHNKSTTFTTGLRSLFHNNSAADLQEDNSYGDQA